MTTTDRNTGLPIVGAEKSKRVPIDPKLLGELRPITEAVLKTRKDGQMIGYQLVLLIGSAAAIGIPAAENETEYKKMLEKIANLHGVKLSSVADLDMETGELILR